MALNLYHLFIGIDKECIDTHVLLSIPDKPRII